MKTWHIFKRTKTPHGGGIEDLPLPPKWREFQGQRTPLEEDPHGKTPFL